MYYEAMRAIHPVSADDYFRTHFQKLVDSKWYESTTVVKIEEETPFASLNFEEVEVRMTHALDSPTLKKQGERPICIVICRYSMLTALNP